MPDTEAETVRGSTWDEWIGRKGAVRVAAGDRARGNGVRVGDVGAIAPCAINCCAAGGGHSGLVRASGLVSFDRGGNPPLAAGRGDSFRQTGLARFFARASGGGTIPGVRR